MGQGPREFTLRHNVLCRDNRARHCLAARLRACDRHALSRQCGALLCRDRECHAYATDQVRRVLAGQTKPSTHNKARAPRLGEHEKFYSVATKISLSQQTSCSGKKTKNKGGPYGIRAS